MTSTLIYDEDSGGVLAARRLLVDALEFTEDERAERNVEAALGLLDARETGARTNGSRRRRPAGTGTDTVGCSSFTRLGSRSPPAVPT